MLSQIQQIPYGFADPARQLRRKSGPVQRNVGDQKSDQNDRDDQSSVFLKYFLHDLTPFPCTVTIAKKERFPRSKQKNCRISRQNL